ncbi:hypothetical protein [Mycobacterium sp. SMC-4]|uniref:hypothetical protein n=1 Tax=Mycobacterium sp. SMC-4 TaxID=2857059 RepID=UPI0021B38543|nr:hypothetical protein [Mycobacterium sp. SMC-4]UXA16745.1 hypothetical protein KXD98_18435 [Mycobacterium sp. SMC-4]
MARIDDLILEAITAAGPKPPDDAAQSQKNPWGLKISTTLALAIAHELRLRGMEGARPGEPGDPGHSGAERRLAGGLGAKKVDVSWATEESGLLLACSVKTIMFRDKQSGGFQKNLTNRRGDLLFESTTLHRRFPFAVVAGFLFLDIGAAGDDTDRRNSTFQNVFPRFRLFTGRADPADRDEQFERLYVLLVDTDPAAPSVVCHEVDNPDAPVALGAVFDDLIELTVERNFDMYEATGEGSIKKARSK